jgi:hypothetical protein
MLGKARALVELCIIGAFSVSGQSFAGTVAHWPFDENGGDTAFDVIGTHDGALAGYATLGVQGVSGGAISLDHTSGDMVNMGDVFGFTSGDFSISVWIKTTTTLPESIVAGKHLSGVGAGYLICINTSAGYGEINKAYFYHSTLPGNVPITTTTVNDGEWHHIVAVYSSGGTATIYVDGSPAEDSGASSPIGSTSAAFVVGGITYGATPVASYTGLVDDLQLYDHALSDEEIDFLFANPGVTVDHIFADGFESGDTREWSLAVAGS